MTKVQRKILIQNRLGLHARAAIKLVEIASGFDALIEIKNQDGKTAEATGVMALLLLESAQGQYVTIEAEGAQACVALDSICALIDAKFDEAD